MGIDVTQWRIEIARYWKFAGRSRHGRGKSPGVKTSTSSCNPLLALTLSFCLITAPSLLLQAGDVERNPGPPKIQMREEGSKHGSPRSRPFTASAWPIDSHQSLNHVSAKLASLLNSSIFMGQTDLFKQQLQEISQNTQLSLERAINYPIRRYNNRTVVHLAASNGLWDCLEELLMSGGDPNARSNPSDLCQTPLHLAAQKGYVKCLEALINHGADIMAKNSQGVLVQDMIRGKKVCERVFQNAMSKRLFSDEQQQRVVDGDHEKYLTACDEAMHKKGKLNQTIIPCVFVGPPGNGKTSLMRRLIGKPPLASLPSTGVAEKIVQVEIRKSSSTAAQINQNSSVWKELTLDDEAVALLMDISRAQALESHSDTSSQSSDNLSTTTEVLEATVPPSSFKPPLEMFKDSLRTKGWSAAHTYLEGACVAHLTDTGGQLEFQELLPALVSGPSVFFLVFRLDQDLNQRFTVEYRHPNKGCTNTYESSYTVSEFLLHTLASIASMGSYMCKGVQKKKLL